MTVNYWNKCIDLLPTGQVYPTSIICNNYIYVIGGFSSDGKNNGSSYYTPLNVNSNGSHTYPNS